MGFAVPAAGCASFHERQVAKTSPIAPVTPAVAAGGRLRQHIATVASVDTRTQTVHLVGGDTLRLTPSTAVHAGKTGQSIALTDVRPGDKLIINEALDPPRSSTTRKAAASTRDTSSSPSALPRDVATSSPPRAPVEVMVFHPAR